MTRPRGLPAHQVAEVMNHIFSEVEQRMPAWDQGTLLPAVEPGSDLAWDDAALAPYQASHLSQHLIGVALDNLHALGSLLGSAHVLHLFAPFTLMRSSIEAAGHAVWLLAPDDGASRASRVLQLHRKNAQDARDAAVETGAKQARSFEAIEADLERIRDRVTPGSSLNLGTTPSVLRSVDRVLGTAAWTTAAWRVTSGFTHGRLWAALAYLDRNVTGSSGDVHNIRITNTSDRVLWPAWAASDALNRAILMYSMRAGSG